MSLIVVDNYENMLNLKMLVRVIIIDTDNFNKSKSSIESVRNISNDIPITILTKNNEYNYPNTEVIKTITTDKILSQINKLLLKKSENYFCILYSGDILLDSFNEPLSKIITQNISSIGAIIFDDYLINEKKHDFKPNFSPDLYLEYDYIKNALFINRNSFNSIGGFDVDFPHNYIRDIVFRLFLEDYTIIKEDVTCFNIGHDLNNNFNENKVFLEKQLSNQDIEFDILTTDHSSKPIYNTQNKKASIIIPFKDQTDVTKTCVESILKKTEYTNYEIILINNNSSDEKTFKFTDKIRKNKKVRVYDYLNPFNWSKINNFGAKVASGDVLIFLNNDTEVISEKWLGLLIGDAIQKRVGVVGAKLFYPDNTIQHAGVVIGLNSLAAHLFAGNSENDIPDLYKLYRRNVSSVTGACLAIEKNLFYKINGFNERFEVSFSDVEICLRLLEMGYDNIFNPDATLYHHEMKTRSNKEFREIDRLLGYSAFSFYFKNGDPFFNTNYSLNNANKLTIKKEGEIPGFEKYWANWSKNRNTRINKIHSIINRNNEKHSFQYDFSNDDLITNGILMDNFFKNPTLKLDNALWFIPSLNHITEDILYKLFMLPNFLSENENTNNYFILSNSEIKFTLINYIKNNFPNMNFEMISNTPNIQKMNAAFCYDWKTAYDLLKYNNCNAKFYIINDNYDNSNNQLKNQTYNFDFIGISDSKNFVTNYKKNNLIAESFYPIVNNKHYFFDSNINKINRSVLFHANKLSDDEFEFGIKILKIVKEYFGNGIKIFVEGKEFDSSKYELDNVIDNLGVIKSSNKLSQYYKQSQVVFNLTSSQNIVANIINSMACGCVNITPFNENLPIFLRDSENIIFTEQTITCIAEDIIRILHDVNLRDKLVNMGLTTVKQLNSRNELENITNFIKNPVLLFNEENIYENIAVNNYIPYDFDNNYNEFEAFINELKYENNAYKNNERALKLINKRNENKIIALNKELNQLKRNSRKIKNNSVFKKILK